MAAPNEQKWATVSWMAGDVQSLKPSWSLEQCEQWLEGNYKYIQDRLVEVGNEVIETLLPVDGDDDEK
jgi:hypothetical protein